MVLRTSLHSSMIINALDDHLRIMKFVQTKGDPCLYVSTDEEPVIIAVYVDNILIAGRTDKRIA